MRTSSSFAQCGTCSFKSESGFLGCKQIVKKICFVVFCNTTNFTNARQKANNIIYVSFTRQGVLTQSKSLLEFIKSVIVTFLIISAVFTNFQLSF